MPDYQIHGRIVWLWLPLCLLCLLCPTPETFRWTEEDGRITAAGWGVQESVPLIKRTAQTPEVPFPKVSPSRGVSGRRQFLHESADFVFVCVRWPRQIVRVAA